MKTTDQLLYNLFPEYQTLGRLQRKVVALTVHDLTISDDEVRKCIEEARGMNGAECMQAISALSNK
jgi:hypothetical protein